MVLEGRLKGVLYGFIRVSTGFKDISNDGLKVFQVKNILEDVFGHFQETFIMF